MYLSSLFFNNFFPMMSMVFPQVGPFNFMISDFITSTSLCICCWTDKRRAKYIIYLFSLLSSTWTHIWSNWIHYCNWHLVCGLCSRWATTWTGYLQSRKFHFLAGYFLFLFFWVHLMYSREWLWILLLSFFFFFGPSQNF